MDKPIVIDFESVPAVAPTYLRALSGGNRLPDGETIPAIESHVTGVHAQRSKLRGYRRVCGFTDDALLPVTYPHVLAFPLHMAVMTHPAFPLKLMGLVHVRNRIAQQKALREDAAVNMTVAVGGHRDVHNGVEFDLTTEVQTDSGDVVWESVSTMLSRARASSKRSGKREKRDRKELVNPHYASWQVPANTGRRYARSAGDINPIHLSMLSAKLLGFPRAIAHGMWLKARAAAQLQEHLRSEHYSIDVAFKRPVLLPSEVRLAYSDGEHGMDFILADRQGEVPHMVGEIIYAAH